MLYNGATGLLSAREFLPPLDESKKNLYTGLDSKSRKPTFAILEHMEKRIMNRGNRNVINTKITDDPNLLRTIKDKPGGVEVKLR